MRALSVLVCVAHASALSPSLTRRQSLSVCGGLCGGLAVPVLPAHAAAKKSSATDGVAAFAGIVEARKVLDKVETLVKGDKYDDAKELLESGSVAAFESNAMALVASPALAAEDKKAIGTIRRYGVGADVLIMLGGLKEAVRDDDARAAKSYLAKSKASLDEVISIAKGSGL